MGNVSFTMEKTAFWADGYISNGCYETRQFKLDFKLKRYIDCTMYNFEETYQILCRVLTHFMTSSHDCLPFVCGKHTSNLVFQLYKLKLPIAPI